MTRKSGYRFSDRGHAPLKAWLKAQIVRLPATTAGILWRDRCGEREELVGLNNSSGANRIARTMNLVIAGLSRSKNGVASLAYDPAISIAVARPCQLNRDGRNKSGHDTIAV
jgi:hypothetical protein